MTPNKSRHLTLIYASKSFVKPNILTLFMTLILAWNIQFFFQQIAPYIIKPLSHFHSPNVPLKLYCKVSYAHLKEENVAGWIK